MTTTSLAWTGEQTTQECQHAFSTSQTLQAPSIERVDASAKNACYVPKSDGPIDTGAQARTTRTGPSRSAPPPGPGDPCTMTWTTGVSLDPPGPVRLAHWTPPDGMNAPSSFRVLDVASQEGAFSDIAIEEVASVTGEHYAQIRYVYRGVGDGVDWTCAGGSWDYADKTCSFAGRPNRGFICAHLTIFGQVTPAVPGPPDPAPFIRPQLADMTRLIVAGQMASSPEDPTRHFVNLPDCWWLNGTQPHQAFDLTIDDPPNPGTGAWGRGLVYTYRIDIGLQDVRWDYGDGSTYNGDAGHPYAEGGCSNAHTYDRVSTLGSPGAVPCPAGYPHPTADDGCYRVHADETYAAGVTASWYDGTTDRIVPMSDIAPFTVSPADTYIRVLQVEGIPVTG